MCLSWIIIGQLNPGRSVVCIRNEMVLAQGALRFSNQKSPKNHDTQTTETKIFMKNNYAPKMELPLKVKNILKLSSHTL